MAENPGFSHICTPQDLTHQSEHTHSRNHDGQNMRLPGMFLPEIHADKLDQRRTGQEQHAHGNIAQQFGIARKNQRSRADIRDSPYTQNHGEYTQENLIPLRGAGENLQIALNEENNQTQCNTHHGQNQLRGIVSELCKDNVIVGTDQEFHIPGQKIRNQRRQFHRKPFSCILRFQRNDAPVAADAFADAFLCQTLFGGVQGINHFPVHRDIHMIVGHIKAQIVTRFTVGVHQPAVHRPGTHRGGFIRNNFRSQIDNRSVVRGISGRINTHVFIDAHIQEKANKQNHRNRKCDCSHLFDFLVFFLYTTLCFIIFSQCTELPPQSSPLCW